MRNQAMCNQIKHNSLGPFVTCRLKLCPNPEGAPFKRCFPRSNASQRHDKVCPDWKVPQMQPQNVSFASWATK